MLELSFARQEQAGEFPESPLRGRRRSPERRILLSAEKRDEERIDIIGFVPAQARLAVAFDAYGIDHAYAVPAFLEMQRHSFPEASRGFHAGVNLFDPKTVQPPFEIFPANQAVAEAAAVRSAVDQQNAIELVFGDI